MIDRKYSKKCNPEQLTRELINAGWVKFDELHPDEPFNFYGVTWNGKQTIVHLRDGETLDPTPIIEAHIYEEPKPIDWREEWKKATNTEEKLDVIARLLKLK